MLLPIYLYGFFSALMSSYSGIRHSRYLIRLAVSVLLSPPRNQLLAILLPSFILSPQYVANKDIGCVFKVKNANFKQILYKGLKMPLEN